MDRMSAAFVAPIEAEFWARTEPVGECLEWRGARQPAGYGRVGRRYAHHIAYTLAYGPIPDGLWVLHHCDNPPCVKPEHLYAGTAQDNADDRSRRGRTAHGGKKRWPPRIACPKGHEFNDANTYTYSSGQRECRLCRRSRRKEERIRHQAAVIAKWRKQAYDALVALEPSVAVSEPRGDFATPDRGSRG